MRKKHEMLHKNMTLTPDTIFARSTQWQTWLDVEAALAQVQGDIGMIPNWAAAKITEAAHLDVIGYDALADDITRTMAPVLSLTRLLGNAAGDAGDYVHWGATTQNVMQTGRILLMRQADSAIRKQLALAARTLGTLAHDEAETMMFREEDDYKAFFKKAMKKFNVSDIEDMSDEDKKDFFNYVDRNYKAKKEED